VNSINLSILSKVINRRVLVVVSLILFVLSMFASAKGTFDNINVQRVSFTVNPKYTYETNIFFNRTILNYAQVHGVSGYLFTPPPYYVALYLNESGYFQGYPTIIWAHGGLGNAEFQYTYAKELAAAGFKVLAVNQPGHGDTGGKYSKGINNLPVLYSAVDYLYYFCWDIDREKIGVAGHSYGGVLTTRGGIFDNWTNPRTGNKIGTGGRITSFGAIYCWDDLLHTTIYMGLKNRPYDVFWPEILYFDPNLQWLFSRQQFLSSTFPFTLPYELDARSVSNFINDSNIGNYMLILGSEDEFCSVPQECLLMEATTKNSSGVPQVAADEIFSSVISKFSWDYGNISENNARKLVIIPGVSHLGEANNPIVLQRLITWFHESFQTGYDHFVLLRSDWKGNDLLRKYWAIGLLAAFSAIPGLVSYLSSWFQPKLESISDNKKNQKLNYLISPRNMEKNLKIRLIMSYCLILMVTSFFGAVLTRNALDIKTFTQFSSWNMVSIPILVISMIQLPIVFIINYFEKRRYHLRSYGPKKSLIRGTIGILITVLPILLMIGLYNISAYFFNVPMLLPRPFEASIYIDFFILFGIMLLFSLVNEVVFRKFIQSKIERSNGKMTSWFTIIKVTLLNCLICL